jgi:hypothetical protein
VAGLAVAAVAVIWAVYVMTELSRTEVETSGYEGFAVIAVLVVATPIVLLLAVIGVIRRERPRYLSWAGVFISSVPIIAVVAKRVLN